MPFAPARVVLACALGAGVLLGTPTAAYAQDGLQISGQARYVIHDDGSPVDVTTTITLTNQTPSTATTFYFWTGYSLWLPTDVADLRASSNGAPVTVRTVRSGDSSYAEVTFPTRLLYGQSRTVVVSYTIPGAKFRSKNPARVGPGFASFEVYSPGDSAQAAVDIVAPKWMGLTLSTGYESTEKGDLRTSTFTGGGESGLWARMALRDESQKTSGGRSVGSDRFTVDAFPGDKTWLAYVEKALPAALPALVELAGSPWPDSTVTITEDATNNVNGYDGRYSRGAITISERLEPALLYHELAHAWANYDSLHERWLVEGLASALATRVAKTLDTEDEKHDRVTPGTKGAFPLSEWPAGSRQSTPKDAYGYPASWWVVDHLLAGSTKKSTGEIVDALISRGSVYAIPGEPALLSANAGWRQAYDIFSVLGGNPKADALMRQWVIDKDDLGDLATRTTTRTSYARFDKRDGPWSPPRGVRAAMATWDFGAAARAMADAAQAAKSAAALTSAAKSAGLTFASVRKAYEGANTVDQYRSLTAQLTGLTAASADYASASAAMGGPSNVFERIGRAMVSPDAEVRAAREDLERGDAAAARSAVRAARAADHRSQTIGIGVVAGGGVVVLLGCLAAWRRVRRR